MKNLKWSIFILGGCFCIGLLTRFPALRIPVYGIHCVLAAPLMSAFLCACFCRMERSAFWPKLLPLVIFGLFLNCITPAMGFYSLGSALFAGIAGMIWRAERGCRVMAVVYAAAGYPLCLLREAVLQQTLQFTLENFFALAAAMLLSVLGVWMDKKWLI